MKPMTPEQQKELMFLISEWYLNTLEYMDFDADAFDQQCTLCYNGRQEADQDYEHKANCRVMRTRRLLEEMTA